MAVQRMKEIGVRKVLGASISQIVIMFSGEFVIMVLLAFLIAAPTGYYLMKEWLSAFAFKISLGVGIFVIALLASLLMAVLTMGYRAYKAAIANPVTSLRSE
jgi:ABC-type antimicrobial peptide transport system permease subunit